jgi:hypothetical protein
MHVIDDERARGAIARSATGRRYLPEGGDELVDELRAAHARDGARQPFLRRSALPTAWTRCVLPDARAAVHEQRIVLRAGRVDRRVCGAQRKLIRLAAR